LSGVAASSASSAWAVGSYTAGTSSKSLVLGWNGTAWKQVPSPTPGGGTILRGAAATSASSAWAVGSYTAGTSTKSLVLEWNGTAWKQVPSPSGVLSAVAATSAASAWAVGSTGRARTLVVRWNGTAWKQVPSPSLGAHFIPFLDAVAATSARNAWAVGDSTNCGCGPGISLILHWNGTTWKQVPSPTPGGGTDLRGVAATSATNAWAVGYSGGGIGPTKTVILRWNGKTWN
jgi:hypothetical protein